MKQNINMKTETISFDEFIDILTEGTGDQIKKDLRKIDRQNRNV